MNLSPFHRRRRTKKGSILIIAVGLMVFITAIFFVVSSYQTQMLQTQQIKLAAKNASLAQSSVLQALRAATYLQYMSDLAAGTTPFTASDYASILTETGVLIAGPTAASPIAITSGTTFTLPQDSGGTLSVKITSPAASVLLSATGGPAGQNYIFNSGTWLDNTPAETAYLPFTISITATPIIGQGTPYTISVTRSIIMAKVNQTALAMAAEADVTLNSGATISGNASVTGALGAGGSATVSAGSVATGSISSNSILQNGLALNRGIVGNGTNTQGFTFRGYADNIDASAASPARSLQSTLQRVDYLGDAIPTDFLYREGMAASGSQIPATEWNLYKVSQPFYTSSAPSPPSPAPSATALNYRIWGTYNTSTGTFTTTPVTTFGTSYPTAASTPTWLTSPTPTVMQSSTYGTCLVVYLDIQTLLNVAAQAGDINALGTKRLVVFVGGTDGSAPPMTGTGTNFNHMYLVLNSCPSLTGSGVYSTFYPASLTIISPNPVVFGGNINSPASASTTFSVIAPSTAFGMGGGASATFTGQVRGGTNLTGVTSDKNLTHTVALYSAGLSVAGGIGQSSGGAANLVAATTPEQAAQTGSEGAGQSLYIALIEQY